MIDLHTHILPGIDDGAKDLQMSLAMARIAVGDGITHMACTPHIYPGLYLNDAAGIDRARGELQQHLDDAGIALQLLTGADVHLVPGLVGSIQAGSVPRLGRSRYFLLEPSHHVAPPRFAEAVFEFVACGYVPVITHPERLSWVEDHFDVLAGLTRQGAWLQVTAGALTGVFGPRAKYWGERFVGEGLTHIIASDAHSPGRRAPILSHARKIAEKLLGAPEAELLFRGRQELMLQDIAPGQIALIPALSDPQPSWWKRLFGARRPSADIHAPNA